MFRSIRVEAPYSKYHHADHGSDVGIWLWIRVGLIALMKVVNRISGFALKKGFVAMHTLANKATGVLLFFLPLLLQLESIKVPSLILTCILATFAAIQEGHYRS